MKKTSLVLAGLGAAASSIAGTVAPAMAVVAQPTNNDYGQTAAQVNTEIVGQVANNAAVKAAKTAMTTAKAKLAAAQKVEKVAAAALKTAKSKKLPKAKITAATNKFNAAHKATVAAQTAATRATAAYNSLAVRTTASVRALHYTPIDGTYTGATASYDIQGIPTEHITVSVTVSGGKVTDVTAADYAMDSTDPAQAESAPYNNYAVPVLIQEAIDSSYDATLASASGATETSLAFAQSLSSAMNKAGFKTTPQIVVSS